MSCKNLPNLDMFSRTDAMAILQEKKGTMWREVGTTEIIMDSLNPEWVASFDVQYKFEENQAFKVYVYHIGDPANPRNMTGNQKVGELEFSLHEVVTAADQILIKPISDKAGAVIEITGEEVHNNTNEYLSFNLEGQFKAGKKMFYVVYKLLVPEEESENGKAIWKPVYKSETKDVNSSSKVLFNKAEVRISDLLRGNQENEVKIEFFISKSNGRHINSGYIEFSTTEMKEKQNTNAEFDLKHGSGSIKLNGMAIQHKASFLEYIFGGCELNLAIAIDFTGSNGSITSPSSLHSQNF